MRLSDEIVVEYLGAYDGRVASGMYPVLKDGDGVLFMRIDQSDIHRFTRVCRVGAIGEASFHRFRIGGREVLVLVPTRMNTANYNLAGYMKAAMIRLRDLLIYFFFESSSEHAVKPFNHNEVNSIDLSRGRVVEL